MMQDEKIIMFRNRLLKVYRHLSKQAKRLNISCFRIYDHDIPEFPFCVERYDDKLYVAEYKRNHRMTDEAHEEWLQKSLDIITETIQVDPEKLFLKLRYRKPGRLGQYQKTNTQKQEFVIEEFGLKFIINLSDYLDTGLFLDHRTTRQLIRQESEGKKVLNLFAYTGSFSVYAAAGGATSVISVDLSKTYLDWARKNFHLNGFKEGAQFQFLQADVLAFLESAPIRDIDLVILDPPTFSNSKRMDDFLDIQRDYAKLINQCLAIMKNGAALYFSTNYRRFVLDPEIIDTTSIKDVTRQTTPFDFQDKLERYCYRLVK